MNNKSEKINAKEKYISGFKPFEEKLNGQSKSFLHDIRKNALDQFSQLEFPTTRNEEWKYTNIAPIIENDFVPALNS